MVPVPTTDGNSRDFEILGETSCFDYALAFAAKLSFEVSGLQAWFAMPFDCSPHFSSAAIRLRNLSLSRSLAPEIPDIHVNDGNLGIFPRRNVTIVRQHKRGSPARVRRESSQFSLWVY